MTVSLNTFTYTSSDWLKRSQSDLYAAIAKIGFILEQKIAAKKGEPLEEKVESLVQKQQIDSYLTRLCESLSLSEFERDILLLCVGLELIPSWGDLCAEITKDPKQNYVTFGLAMSVLDHNDWSAFSPAANLRKWRLVEIGAGNALTASPLRVDERILHYLMGDQHLDERLLRLLEPIIANSVQIDSHQQVVNQAIATWVSANKDSHLANLPVLQLSGDDVASKMSIASDVCNNLDLTLYKIPANLLPHELINLQLIAQLCDREYALNDIALLLDCDRDEAPNPHQDMAIGYLIEILQCPLIISSQTRRRQHQRTILTFDVRSPSVDEQQILWEESLSDLDSEIKDSLNGSIHELVSYFNLSPTHIYNASLKAKSTHLQSSNSTFHQSLWNACRAQSRPRLDELAQSVETTSTWEDLILPSKEKFVLHDIAAHVRQRLTVYEKWGFAGRSRRGLGISALFAGTSGTGKTMAAEVLGNELQLDVYRVDLSSVIDKYIGETEKNLKRIFDAAEGGGVILLFDEADALFGKRTEVKDSHDRHANVGVSYLLQRMEAYRGLAVLTTNLKNSLDQAFLRRLRFVIQFPFPDAEQRAEIWRRAFPKLTPTLELDYLKLGKLSVAGGNIRNIALNSAFIAADHNEPVQMKHILQAAKIEYIKLEKPMMDAEIKGWV
jgi:ATPase family associated with various cellular activities (AAA)